MEENQFISKYLSKLAKKNRYALDLNDDVFFDYKKKIVLSVDTYNEGIHFFDFKRPNLLIKKILRSSISDLICKGVKPKYYFISASIKNKEFKKKFLKEIIKSLSHEQKKYNIIISGGDTSLSKFFSFTIVSLGYSSKIIKRNNAKINDDIYITGNIGDSYLGLKFILNKVKKYKKKQKNYFVKKYYLPDLPHNFYKTILKFSNSSTDVSDGLIDDIKKLINKQRLGFKIDTNLIPTSKNFDTILLKNKLNREDQLFNGDDYQVLFTAPKKYRRLINKYAYEMNQKITIIGQILSNSSGHLLYKGKTLLNIRNYKGYRHNF